MWSKLRASSLAQAIALVILYAFRPLEELRTGMSVMDPDIWWHLRVGEWILQHRAVPRVDYFSSFAAGHPWVAYSWLYEVIVRWMYERLGFISIPVYSILLTLAITFALHRLLRKLLPDFYPAVVLTALGILAMSRFFSPRPWLFTALFYILEMDILLAFRSSRKARVLWWLVPIFILWANLHIQFVYGLLVLALAVLEPYLRRPASRLKISTEAIEARGTRQQVMVLVATFAATFVNPYGWKLYGAVAQYLSQTAVYDIIGELKAPGFRFFSDYVELLVLAAAFVVLAIRRPVPLLPSILLIVSTPLAFRTQRDVWFMTVSAVALIAWQFRGQPEPRPTSRSFQRVLVPLALTLVLLAGALVSGFSQERLRAEVAAAFPVNAVRYIEQNGLGGRLYNTIANGGFLMFALPRLPVAIDGRTNLYGNSRNQQFYDTMMGRPSWSSDPDLDSSQLVVVETEIALASLLRLDPRFQLLEEDDVACVFARRVPGNESVKPGTESGLQRRPQ